MSSTIAINKKTKLSSIINHQIKIHTIDNRYFIGTLLSFDKHMNLVLSDTVESRITKKSHSQLKKHQHPEGEEPVYEKRNLGLIILRGEQIVSLSIESNGVISNIKDRIIKQPISRKKKTIA